MGPHLLAQSGQVAMDYTEADGVAYMKNDSIVITVDLGLGEGKATVYGCDLTHGYIEINADYRSMLGYGSFQGVKSKQVKDLSRQSCESYAKN